MHILWGIRRLGAAALMILCSAAAAQAQISAPTPIGSNQINNTTGTTLTITTTAAAPAGSTILVAAANDATATGVSSCSDGGSNSYNVDTSDQTASTMIALCSGHVTTALPAGAAITVTFQAFPGTGNERAQAFVVSGLTAAPLDRVAPPLASSTNNHQPSTTLLAPTSQPNELLFAVLGAGNEIAGNGFTVGDNGTGDDCAGGTTSYTAVGSGVGTTVPALFAMQCIVSATATYKANASFTHTTAYTILLASYKGAPQSPTVTGVTPSAGSFSGGGTVTITGTNLAGATQVLFGTIPATNIAADGPTTLTVTAPPGAAGFVDVTVTTPDGTSPITPADRFDYAFAAPALAPWALLMLAGGLGFAALWMLRGRRV